MKIVLFDDHPAILDAVTQEFTTNKSVSIVGAHTTSNDFLKSIDIVKPDIVIIDLLTDEEIGTSLIKKIKDINEQIHIIVYSSLTSTFIINTLLDSGVRHFVNKKDSPKKLLQTILEFSNELPKNTIKSKKTNHESNLPSLTTKEREIVQLMIQGFLSDDIAKKLGNSKNTINNQKNHLISKFGCKSSTELVIKITKLGYLSL